MEKFKIIKEKGGKLPDNYLFFTNVVLTGVLNKGGRDKIEDLCKHYRENLIPNICIFGYDDLCRFLDNNRDVATAYSSFTLPGDVLLQLTNLLNNNFRICTTDHMELLIRFLEKEFKDDMVSRLEQGGQLTDEKVNLEKVFIDLSIVSNDVRKQRKIPERFVKKLIAIGDNINKPDRMDVNNKLVIIGGPGQGKSTLTQFLCQIYRAFFLKNNSQKNLLYETSNFIKGYTNMEINEPNCIRFPLRIILKEYAGWMIKQQDKTSVLEFLQYKIETKGKGSIGLDDLRKLLGSLSFLFVFDGLDEVPATSNRVDVLNEINDFLDIEIRRQNCDAVIIGTTRPQGYTKEFDNHKFEHFELVDLTTDDCFKYLKKLMVNFDNSDEQMSIYLEILSAALSDPVIKRLMMSPLQATIMAILVKSGGEPPRNRYSLFTQYYLTILNREKQKGVVKVLNDEFSEYIDLIHYKLGFTLQKNSEGFENPSSSVSHQEFSDFVSEILIEEMGVELEKAQTFIEDILFAITDRLVFISEVEDSKIGFNIRSMQEYFAANYYLHNQPDSVIPYKIKIIAKNAYWRNTFLFAMGYLAKYKNYLIDVVLSMCGDLNGDSQEYEELTIERISKLGSWLALDLLCEGVFRSRQREENKFCRLLEELFKIAPIEEHRYFGKLPDSIQEKFVENFIIKYISSKSSVRESITAWTIACYLGNSGNERIDDIFIEYWPKGNEESIFLIKYLLSEGAYKNQIVISKLLESIENNSPLTYYQELRNENLLYKISDLDLTYKVKQVVMEAIFYIGLEGLLIENDNLTEIVTLISGQDLLKIDKGEHIVFDRINEIRIEFSNEIDLVLKSIINTNPNLPQLNNIFNLYEIDYLYDLTNFIMSPNEQNLLKFLNSIMSVDSQRLELLKSHRDYFNWVIDKVLYMFNQEYDNIIEVILSDVGTLSEWEIYEKNIHSMLEDNRSIINEPEALGLGVTLKNRGSNTSLLDYIENVYKPHAKHGKTTILHILFFNLICFSYEINKNDELSITEELLSEVSNAALCIPVDQGSYLLSRAWSRLIPLISGEQLLNLVNTNDEDIFRVMAAQIDYLFVLPVYEVDINASFHKILSVLAVCNKETSLVCYLIVLLGHQQGTNKLTINSDYEFLKRKKFKDSRNEISRLLIIMLLDRMDEGQLHGDIRTMIDLIENDPELTSYIINSLSRVQISTLATEKLACNIHSFLNKRYEDNFEIITRYVEYVKEISEIHPTSIKEKNS